MTQLQAIFIEKENAGFAAKYRILRTKGNPQINTIFEDMKKILTFSIFLLLSICCAQAGRPQRVVVLGDSYSTFEGCIPEGYSSWYFTDENKGNDVHSADQCWWSIFCRETGSRLLLNSSFSGSTVCNTGYQGSDATRTSFITRMKYDIALPAAGGPGNGAAGPKAEAGPEAAAGIQDGGCHCRKPRCGKKPGLILIFGGTNDVWCGAPTGEPVEPGCWETANLKEFYPATCYMLGYLKYRLPKARIVLICNTELGAGYEDTYAEIARMYGVDCLQLHDISKKGGHPDIDGMRAIADQLEEYLK